jgi:hypothetical protein
VAGGDTLKDFFLKIEKKKTRTKKKEKKKKKKKKKPNAFLHKRRGGLRERP